MKGWYLVVLPANITESNPLVKREELNFYITKHITLSQKTISIRGKIISTISKIK